jgi:hypothetical protein
MAVEEHKEFIHDSRVESIGWEDGIRGALDSLARTLSERKYRLLMAGLFRSLGEFAAHPKLLKAYDHIEHYADTKQSPRRLSKARGATQQVCLELTGDKWGCDLTSAVAQLCHAVDRAACSAWGGLWHLIEAVRLHQQCDEQVAGLRLVPIFRDIVGTPFHDPAFDLGWRTSAVVAIAEQMYTSRDFAAMPILADALQEAGCDSDGVLSHCRGAGPHVRGCWVIDLILRKGLP